MEFTFFPKHNYLLVSLQKNQDWVMKANRKAAVKVVFNSEMWRVSGNTDGAA